MLIDCIKSAGDNLSDQDRNFLLNELSNGATDDQALDNLAEAIRKELDEIAGRVEEQGGKVSRERPEFLSQTVWQGSPHKYDGILDPTKIGTGEGAQAYGYGHYLAESPDVAETYVGRGYDIGSLQDYFDDAYEYLQSQGLTGDALDDAATDASHLFAKGKFDQINSGVGNHLASLYPIPEGHLYKFDLDDNAIENMLDWDAPISQQQPEIRNALVSKINEWADFMGDESAKIQLKQQLGEGADAPNSGSLYQEVARMLGSDKAASQLFQEAGIPGIKYYDGTSRAAGEGTRNFVVFPGNEHLVIPISRNGEPLTGKAKEDAIEYLKQTLPEENLVNIHNLSAEGILAADELGGLAAPSLATVRVDRGEFTGFGEVSLIASPDFIMDPKARAFDADIYSPRQPRAHYKVDFDKVWKFRDQLDTEGLDLEKPDPHEMEGTDGPQTFLRSSALEYHWLKTQGKAPKPKKLKLDPKLKKFVGMFQPDIIEDPKFIETVRKMRQAELDALTADGFDVKAEKMVDWYFEEDGSVKHRVLRDVANEIYRYTQAKGIDVYQVKSDIAKKMRSDKLRKEYESWATDQFNQLVDGKTLFKGYTNSGNRRYVEYNMQNVIKEMTQQLRAGENFFYGAGTVRASYIKEFKTLDKVKASRDKIISDEDFKKIKDESNERFSDALEALKPYYKYSANSFGYMDDAGSAIAEGGRALRDAFNMTPEAREIIDDITTYLAGLPTSYFETKFQRPVQFSEFETAVVPRGMRKDALQVLKDAGLKIRVYNPKVKGDRARVIQQLKNVLFQKDRGRYFLANRTIQLTEHSDLSSFLHESGHYFLEMEKMFAAKYGLDENQKAILEWLGLESFDDITREHHEMWAETFEIYLREGKAPSLGLRRAFASFARWLKQIYKVLVGDPRLNRAKLDPEITGIFDRLLATEEEIEAASAKPEYDQFFQSKEQAGMTDAQWERYQAQAAKVRDSAEQSLDEKAIEQYMRMKTKEWKDERAPMIAEEKEKLSKLPAYQILSDITVRKDPETGDKIGSPMDTEKLKALFPDGKIPKQLAFKHVTEGGTDPAMYAEAYGYPSAKAMIKDIMSRPSLGKAAEDAAQARMVEKYGDVINDGTLEQEAREALINDEQAKLLLMEIKAMRSDARTQGLNREYLKAQAEAMISGMTYKEIKPNRFYQAMIRAAQRAATAEDPTEAKIQQLANHYLYKEALRVNEQMDKHRRFIRKKQTQQYDTSKVNPEYAQQIAMLANLYEMRQGKQQEDSINSILNFYQAQIKLDEQSNPLTDLQLVDPNLIAALDYRENHGGSLKGFRLTSFDDMTAEDLHGVVDMLRHLRYVGGQLSESSDAEIRQARTELAESVEANGGKDHPVQRGKQRQAEGWRRAWNELVNTLPALGNMIRKLDGGKDGGKAFDYIYRLINEANGKRMELTRKFYDQMEESLGDMYKLQLSRKDAEEFVDSKGRTQYFSSEEIFMMTLYWGTDTSREAIMAGHDLTAVDVMQLMSRLTKDQLNMVNAVWSMNENQWPELRDAAVEMMGFAPPKLPPAPFEINGVAMTGGHMQLMYDSNRVELATERQVGQQTSNVVPTKAGSLNARVGSGGQPVLLDINNITRSINDKIQYIAFARAGRRLRQLLVPNEVKLAIEKKHGPGFYEAFIKSIETITAGRPAQESVKAAARIGRHIRSAASLMHLGYSIRNTVQQFSAWPIAAAEVGPGRLIKAVLDIYTNPGLQKEMVNDKSGFMRNRAEVVNREIHEAIQRVTATNLKDKAWHEFKSRAFIMQTTVDSMLAYPTWLAAYEKAMESHADEARARIDADDAVSRSIGSGSDIHLGRILQSNQSEYIRTLTMFGSWFNNYYQRLYRSSNGFDSGLKNYFNPQFAKDALVLPIIVASIGQLLIGDMPDDDEEFWEYLLKNYSLFMLGTVPFARDIGAFAQGYTPVAPTSAPAAGLVRLYQEAGSYNSGRQSVLKTGTDVGKVATSFVPVPGSGQVWRILDGIDANMQGGNQNPLELVVEGRERDN